MRLSNQIVVPKLTRVSELVWFLGSLEGRRGCTVLMTSFLRHGIYDCIAQLARARSC